jgi:hypothetical protein
MVDRLRSLLRPKPATTDRYEPLVVAFIEACGWQGRRRPLPPAISASQFYLYLPRHRALGFPAVDTPSKTAHQSCRLDPGSNSAQGAQA